jgi:serine/threonine protein kinase
MVTAGEVSGTGAEARNELAVGERFGRYRIDARLGQGSMGTVYRATHEVRSGPFALKVLRAEHVDDPKFRQRFLYEARAASTVRHPHLVAVVDSGEVGGLPFLSMPFIEGRRLTQIIAERGPLSITEAVQVATEIGGALDALHAAGLMHRDVKPSNILVDALGASALTDFGLAKGDSGYPTVTSTGSVVGTLEYLAPERIQSQPATPASDLYALGCTVFECLIGDAPFAGGDQMRAILGHLREDPPNPALQRPELPLAFGEVVIRALAKDPAQRQATATEYAAALAGAAPPPSSSYR